MESALHYIIKNLCEKYCWSYGAFWSYDKENPLLLTLEKVYFVDENRVIADDMFQKVYVVGDGLVGQVAFSGIHSWVSSDTPLEEDLFQLVDIFQVPANVQCQFSMGFMTVAVVPLKARGVAQFGSFAKITESVEFIDEAKRLFSEIETVNESISISQQDESFNIDLLELDQLLSPTWNHQPALYEPLPPLVDACPQSSQSDQMCFSPMLPSTQTSIQPNVEPNIGVQAQQCSPIDSLGSDDFELLASLLEDPEEISLDHVLENCQSLMDSTTDNAETRLETLREINDFQDQELIHGLLNEPQAVSYGFGSNILPTNANYNNNPQHQVPSHREDLSRFGQVSTSRSWVSKFNAAHESVMGITRNMPTYSTLLLNRTSSQRPKYNIDWTTLGRRSLLMQGTEGYPLKFKPMGASKVGVTKVAKVVKKKAKPGEARHRPKDRELQHKFYKQLRSLVPDGEKCTQDGLLKRTIRHIRFLQSMSMHTDTLKHGYHLKLLENHKRLLGEDSANDCTLESAETLGSPITVEVLSPTGLYVIELTRDGRLSFLETLDRLRGHGLNIVNGVMEAQKHKSWAYFFVETIPNSSTEDIHQLMRKLLDELDSNSAPLNQEFNYSQGKSQPTTSVDAYFPHSVTYDRF